MKQNRQLKIPEQLARKADQRAFEIFSEEARFDASFKKCLGMIYMVGVRAGIECARPMVTERNYNG